MGVVVEALGQPQVGELGDAVRVKEDVVGLHVAMDEVMGVHEGQCLRDVDADLDGDADREPSEAPSAAWAVGPSTYSRMR